jgi:UDP-glucose 4-epimerase
LDEKTPVIDPDIYGASKYLGERIFADAADKLPCIALRLPGILGRGAHRAWLPTLLARSRAGREITIYNPDGRFNNAAHVDDIARFVHRLIVGDWKGFLAFPIGASGTMTIGDVVARLQATANSHVPVVIEQAPQRSFIICSDYAISFGYKPMAIGEMLDRYVAESLESEDPLPL